jgi:hypothetical protein
MTFILEMKWAPAGCYPTEARWQGWLGAPPMTTLTANPAPVKTTRKAPRPAHGTCPLTLTINSVPYKVRPIDGRAFGAVRAFRLTKQAGAGDVYDVAEDRDGHARDCPDFTFRREGLDSSGCKHIKAMVACGLLSRKGVGQ